MSDCIFEIHQLWQSVFSRVCSNSCCSCSFKPEIIKIGQSSHRMYSNNILNFQVSTTILHVHTKKVWKLIVCTLKWYYLFVCIELDCSKYWYLSLTTQINIIHLSVLLKEQTVLFLTIQFSIGPFFGLILNVKQLFFTHRSGANSLGENRPGNNRNEGILNIPHCIQDVIFRILVRKALPLCRDAIGLFYKTSRLGDIDGYWYVCIYKHKHINESSC